MSTKRFESDASGVPEILHAFTAQPDEDALKGRLERLNSFPEALLILNHPLWDEKQIGLAQHEQTLKSLLAFSRNRLHALEVNGLRSFAENRRVMDLGDMVGWPVVSGGDRHGCEPNAILNLTEASTFDEFAQQVRSGRSHVVFMPQYREPLTWRTMRTVVDNVVMRGVLLGEELATAYADMDLFAFPSRTDTFGNVVLEALSSGVPALVSGGGGPKHIVQHGKTGFVAESDEEFTGYVQYAFKNRHRLRRMGSEARSYAKRQDWDAVFHRVFSAYETCLAAKSRDFNSELRRDPVLLRKSAP